MSSFTDRTGDTWRIDFDVAMIEDIKRDLDVDLLHLGALQSLVTIRDNSLLLVDVLEIVCQDQIRSRELDPRGFAQRFDGQTIADAQRGMLEGLVAFFPPDQRPVIAKALEKSNQMTAHLNQKAMEKLDDPSFWDSAIRALDVMTSGKSSMSSPPSATPMPAPLE